MLEHQTGHAERIGPAEAFNVNRAHGANLDNAARNVANRHELPHLGAGGSGFHHGQFANPRPTLQEGKKVGFEVLELLTLCFHSHWPPNQTAPHH